MRILLDENMPAKVNYDFGEGHEVRTVKDNKPETIQPFVEKIKTLLQNGSDLPKLTELPSD